MGHVRGAFTGAVRDHQGRLASRWWHDLADEIVSLPLASQAKLLRVLQEKEFEPVGSSTTIKMDVRVMASDNLDLAQAVHQGTFREDPYYRLNGFPMKSEAQESLSLRERLCLCERQAIIDALNHSSGVKKKAAQLLGIHPKNLSHLLRKHGL